MREMRLPGRTHRRQLGRRTEGAQKGADRAASETKGPDRHRHRLRSAPPRGAAVGGGRAEANRRAPRYRAI